MRVSLICLFLSFAVLFAPAAYANHAQHRQKVFIPAKDDMVKVLATVARDGLPQAKLRDGSFVGEETEEERAQELIPFEDKRRVVERGIVSSFANICGFDEIARSFLPFMQEERSEHEWSDKQSAYIGLLHGVTFGVMERRLSEEGKGCPDHLKRRVSGFLYEE